MIKVIPNKGFIFLDILFALLIVSVGFLVVIGLNNSTAQTQLRAENYLQAVNLASSAMDQTLTDLEAGIINLDFNGLPLEEKKQIGKYERNLAIRAASEDMLEITVEIVWSERGNRKNYVLYSLYYRGNS